MDPIFDRLGRLIRSLGVDSTDRPRTPRSGDSFDQEAEDELEEFLRTGRDAPRKTASQGGKTFQEQRKHEQHGETKSGVRADPALLSAFATLEISPSATWEAVNASHRALLKKHHPDRQAGNETAAKQATVQSQRINEAFQTLKKHFGR